jgi:hypothetical protein
MSDHHNHAHAHVPHVVAEAPTLSLLRMSAAQRLLAAGVILAGLWIAVWAVIG